MCPSNSTHSATRSPEVTGGPPVAAGRVAHRPDAEAGFLRASDAERETATAELRAHAAAGRLDVDELEARIGDVLAARTRADVAATLADLPETGAARTVATPRPPGQPLRVFASVMVLLLAIWLVTGAGHFWPLYPAIGWGLPLLLARGCARRPQTLSRP